MVPPTEPVLSATLKNSEPSVDKSADGDTLNDPAFELIVNDPLVEEKSAELVWKKSIDQYNVVPFVTLVVDTLKVPELPSLIEDGIVPKLYDGEND